MAWGPEKAPENGGGGRMGCSRVGLCPLGSMPCAQPGYRPWHELLNTAESRLCRSAARGRFLESSRQSDPPGLTQGVFPGRPVTGGGCLKKRILLRRRGVDAPCLQTLAGDFRTAVSAPRPGRRAFPLRRGCCGESQWETEGAPVIYTAAVDSRKELPKAAAPVAPPFLLSSQHPEPLFILFIPHLSICI